MRGGLRRASRAQRVITIVLVASAVLAGAAARAAQTPANKAPRVSGPLSLAASSCQGTEAKHEGRTIARLESCLRLYEFDEVMEIDPLRTYGVGWVQTTVDPVNGWCATKVRSDLVLPNDVTRHSSVPARSIEPKKGGARTTVKIVVDADGHALEEGSVAQSFKVFPKSWKPSVTNGGRTIGTTWKGRESSALAFALGAEISWEFATSPRIKGGLGNMNFVKGRGC